MSLNSLQNSISQRAASMAAMAQRAKNPQEIQAIQQRLITDVQNGTIQPYIGIPLIQDLTKKLAEAKSQIAQTMAGAGMPPPPQGGTSIAQQVIQEARGVEALPSNLPQQYAGGGIIAFEDGGRVERYQNAGYTGDPMGMGGSEITDYAGTTDPYVGSGLLGAITSTPNEPEWKRKLKLEQALRERDAAMVTKPPVLPIATPVVASPPPVASAIPPVAPPVAPAIPTGVNFKMPTLAGMKETPAPVLKDYDSLVAGLPEKSQAAFEEARKKEEDYLRSITSPGETARESRFNQREAQLEKDTAIGRALGLISTGLGVAGSKERTLAGALGNEGRQGIADLIRGEAANRVAKERLEDARDNFEQQKIAAAKGDRAAANAAGQRASEDVRVGTQMTMQAAHYGNTDALNRYQTEQQGQFQKASLQQSGALGIAGLNLQAQHLAQTGAFQNKQLDMMQKRYEAMDKTAQARMQQVHASAVAKFNETIGPQINAQLIKEYGANWRTSQDPRSLEAQMKFKQAQNAYIIDALGQHDAMMSAKDSSEF
jgi:hypothetical protein